MLSPVAWPRRFLESPGVSRAALHPPAEHPTDMQQTCLVLDALRSQTDFKVAVSSL
jgi:hypothetical protein